MLLEKLYKKISKFLRRMEHRIFGPSRKEMLLLSRYNRTLKKEQDKKRNDALKRLIIECSTIKPKSPPKPFKRNNDGYDDRRSQSSPTGSTGDRDDSGEYAYQTGHLF